MEKKGIEYAIRAVARFASGRRGIHYDIVGEGILRDSLQQLIHELGVEDIVRLRGSKNHHDVVGILDRSHILISPSITAKDGSQEGIANVLKEAMAMGLPVIGTEHAGTPELITDGVSGFLVPERDVDGLVDRLTYLADHPGIWNELGRAGRLVVEKHYDISQLNEELIGIYQRLLEH